jgi:cyanophycinase-like exopeptidase
VSPSFALLGSGEFEPWNEPFEQRLLAGSPRPDGSVLILPTASAPEGDEVFDRWAGMGLDHFADEGIPAEVVPLKTREDANRADLVARLDVGAMVFFSGGNPAYLAGVLAGSAFWAALLKEMGHGLPFAGCSAGVNCLGDSALDASSLSFGPELWKPGLGLFPATWFGVHWDAVDTYVPGATAFIISSVAPASRLVTIDERTALVGDGDDWTVFGSGAVSIMERGEWRTFETGRSFELALPPSLHRVESAPA